MTKDELFKKFWDESHCTEYLARRKFDEIIAPYLAIPRSLKDDPPANNQKVVLFREAGAVDYAYYSTVPTAVSWLNEQGLTHWIPFPELPQPDEDEQEFEEFWSHRIDTNREHKAIAKHSWMAARGKK